MNLVIDVAVGGFGKYEHGLAKIRDEWEKIYVGLSDNVNISEPCQDIPSTFASPTCGQSLSPPSAFITEVGDTSVISKDGVGAKTRQLSVTRQAQRVLADRLVSSVLLGARNVGVEGPPCGDGGERDIEDSTDASGSDNDESMLAVKSSRITMSTKDEKIRLKGKSSHTVAARKVKRGKGSPVDIMNVLETEYDLMRRSSTPPPIMCPTSLTEANATGSPSGTGSGKVDTDGADVASCVADSRQHDQHGIDGTTCKDAQT